MKTILLVFIHGFKGGDNTFGAFPSHLSVSLSNGLVGHGIRTEIQEKREKDRKEGGSGDRQDYGDVVQVLTVTYPKFETRGELRDCVGRFSEWLQNTVIDLEVANKTPSPTVDPSVYTVLVGHSMGGIVGAETALSIAGEEVLSTTSQGPDPASAAKQKNTTSSRHSSRTTTTFPRILGLLSYDTPFLGLSPGVIAHGAEGHYKTASSAYSAFTELSSAFGWRSNSSSKLNAGTGAAKPPPSGKKASQPRQPTAGLLANSDGADAAASPSWQSWGKYAMFAGAAGAAAAGGAAAMYSQRDKINSGWGWVSGHLEFVGVLVKGEELKGRIERVGKLAEPGAAVHQRRGEVTGADEQGDDSSSEKGDSGFKGSVVFYTALGRGADAADHHRTSTTTTISKAIATDGMGGNRRTFVKLPPSTTTSSPRKSGVPSQHQQRLHQDSSKNLGGNSESGLTWLPAINEKAPDEVTAHTSMFFPKENPGFYALAERSVEILLGWVAEEEGLSGCAGDSRKRERQAPAGGGRRGGRKGEEGDGLFGGERSANKETVNVRHSDSDGQNARKRERSRYSVTTPAPAATTDGDGNDDSADTNSGRDAGWEKADYRSKAKQAGTQPEPESEAVWVNADEGEGDGDLRMRDDDGDGPSGPSGGDDGHGEDLESSVVVDKAS